MVARGTAALVVATMALPWVIYLGLVAGAVALVAGKSEVR